MQRRLGGCDRRRQRCQDQGLCEWDIDRVQWETLWALADTLKLSALTAELTRTAAYRAVERLLAQCPQASPIGEPPSSQQVFSELG